MLWVIVCSAIVALAGRPSPGNRKFNSTAVNTYIAKYQPLFKDTTLGSIWGDCLPNTLDTTVVKAGQDDTFIITGDIDAMWLRDSTNQVLPYMRWARSDTALQNMLEGLVRRQVKSVLLDSYANAYNIGPNGHGHQDDKRKPKMTPAVFEGKYELDSLCAVMLSSYSYWNATGNTAVFDTTWAQAMSRIIDTIEVQLKSTEEDGDDPAYTFQRGTTVYPNPRRPVNRNGLSKCGFRPSDDPTERAFLVPANAMAVANLERVAQVASNVNQPDLSHRAATLASSMRAAVEANGTKALSGEGMGYVYETDGFGIFSLMDDGNIPSLLSLPYLGYLSKDDPKYVATRSWVLSQHNPWYFSGTVAKGVGSPHTGFNRIWPMSIMMQALTSDVDSEILQCLAWLKASAAGTGFMHESFNKNDAHDFTRPWFAWANSLFGELIVRLIEEKPHLILKSDV